jgi:hypothetical protein
VLEGGGGDRVVHVVDPDNPSIAGTYTAVADVLLKIARISGSKKDLDNAAAFASAAVLAAPAGKLKADAYAALGAVSQENGKFDVAIPA